MARLTVNLAQRSYDIIIEQGILSQVGVLCKETLPKAQRLALVTDSNVAAHYGVQVVDSLKNAGFTVAQFTVPAGEESKNMEQLTQLLEGFMDFGLNRTDGVVALGGGVVGDLTGFAASAALRGLDFIQIPTTLLAQVDSSVGGKVAVNLQAGKNLAGAFHQPKLVIMDPNTLRSLDDATFADGMAEVIKYGCIMDEEFFQHLENNPSRVQIMENIDYVLYQCCELKRRVVVEDELDHGNRMLLNYGHTLGHAFELAGNYTSCTHGQAVSAGMCAINGLSVSMGLTPKSVSERIASLLEKFQLPTQLPCTQQAYTQAVALDKKGTGAQVSLILLPQLGRAVIHPVTKEMLGHYLEEQT